MFRATSVAQPFSPPRSSYSTADPAESRDRSSTSRLWMADQSHPIPDNLVGHWVSTRAPASTQTSCSGRFRRERDRRVAFTHLSTAPAQSRVLVYLDR